MITRPFSAAATSPRPMGQEFVLDVFRIRNGWDPVLAASCVLFMLTAYSHELPLSLLCSGCCCTVGTAARSWRFCGILHVLALCISLEWCAGIS